MKVEFIKATFINLLFVAGVVLLIVGFSMGAMTAVRTIMLPEYPLSSWEESRCELDIWPLSYSELSVDRQDDLSQEEIERQEQRYQERLERCLESNEKYRTAKQISDGVRAITFIIAGGILAIFFRGYLFSKKSK